MNQKTAEKKKIEDRFWTSRGFWYKRTLEDYANRFPSQLQVVLLQSKIARLRNRIKALKRKTK